MSSKAGIAAALALAAWRIAVRPPGELWRDLVLVAAVFWLVDAAVREPRARPWTAAAAAAYLFVAYMSRHGPFLLEHLRLAL